MPSTNGHGPKRAILYARVSTNEQARSGYSLAQQMEALRGYAAREGYEILEEVADPGQSGASLARPGMDRVRDLVAAESVSVVLAQDRDRFAREPAYHYLLKREFEEHGCKLKALNDRGDDTPEGELTDGILDQLAKFERAKITERSRRGKLRKTREGKVIATMKPPYGFEYNAARDGLVVRKDEMAVVEKIFRLAADGLGTSTIQNHLYHENVPSPKGAKTWQRATIKRLVMSDLYKPHTYDETAELVSAEVASALDPAREYGIRWWNRFARKIRQVSEPDGTGGRHYRRRITTIPKSREEWLAAPIPASLPRQLVDRARTMMAMHRPSERKHFVRDWELRGFVRCGCGASMGTHTTSNGRKLYHYYRCNRGSDYKRGVCEQKSIRAEAVEASVWRFVSSLLQDPENIKVGLEELIEQQRAAGSRDPEKEATTWAEKIGECDRLRRAYQDQQAAGLMTLKELRERLGELDDISRMAQAELKALADREERIKELERDRDALLEQLASTVPDALGGLTPGKRNELYRVLRLQVTPVPEGYSLSGVFCSPDPLHG